jgi:sugar phosphate isomerase/epimerase
MNNPFAPLLDEIARIGSEGFDFLDLTLEPPCAWPVDAGAIRSALDKTGLEIVGHTAFFLPIASPYPALRSSAISLFADACEVFETLGATLVNVHPDPVTRSYPRDAAVAQNVSAMTELAEIAEARGLRLMLENLGPQFGAVEHLEPLLAADDRIGFHLDVGHANLGGSRFAALLDAFGERLTHVHVSDNFGVDDLHLPLGAGSIDWPEVVDALRRRRYDGTVTVEVFSARYVSSSAELWRTWWNAASERS